MDYWAGLWQRKTLETARTEERGYLKQQFSLFFILSKEGNTFLLLSERLWLDLLHLNVPTDLTVGCTCALTTKSPEVSVIQDPVK